MTARAIVLGSLMRAIAAVFVVAILLFLAGPARETFVPAISAIGQVKALRDQIKGAGQEAERLAKEANLRLEQARNRSSIELTERLKAIDRALGKLAREPSLRSTSYLDVARAFSTGSLEAALRNEVHKDILQREREALERLDLYVRLISDRKSLEEQAKALDKKRDSAKQAEIAAEARFRNLERQAACRVPFTPCSTALEDERKKWFEANEKALRTYREWAALDTTLRSMTSIGSAPIFRIDQARVQSVLDDMTRQVERVESWGLSTLQPAKSALGAASLIVFGALAVGVGMKAFFFFVLAPLAEHRPPLIVRQSTAGTSNTRESRSALSLQVGLSPGEELVVMGSHIQSLTDGCATRTKWLFSTTYPVTSFLSGLWMLTRVNARAPCEVVLSATTDVLEELNSVRLERGCSLVVLPRHVVGVVHPLDSQVRLRSCWKLGLHAWLTLQFRYLVIEGPCQVIVGGCRGVRIEAADGGRVVSQAMMVGFSSHLEYTVSRTETFTAYLIGQRPLFNDRLRGPGVVLYQEVPSTAQRGGFTGRGLQGVADGAMKAFGL